MLQDFGDEIWLADGPVEAIMGFRYATRMAVIRLGNGALFIWSPVKLTSELRDAVDHLGAVRHIVAPNSLHHLFVADWQSAYPDAQFHAAPGLREKRPDLRWDADLADMAPPQWSDEIDQVIVYGNKITTEVVFFHRQSRTAIFADLIQNFEPGWFKGWRAIAAKLDFMTADKPTVPRKFRMAFSDRDAARSALAQILDWPTQRMIAAHCPPVLQDGHAAIAHAFDWLRVR